MRFSFRRKEEPRWVDTPDFVWVPDTPFDFAPSNDAAPAATPAAEPESKPEPESVQAEPAPDAKAEPTRVLADEVPDLTDTVPGLADLDFSPAAESPFTMRDAAETPPPQAEVSTPLVAENPLPEESAPDTDRAARHDTGPTRNLLLPRLAIGLAQGLGLYLLLKSRAAGLMPGADPFLFSALSLIGLLAPLVLIEALGDIALPLLLAWTGAAAAGLAVLGFYHHWRLVGVAADGSHPGFALILLCAIALFVAQALVRTWLSPRSHRRAYRVAFEAGWTLAARLAVWMPIAAIAWAFLGMGASLVNWLRPQGVDIHFDPALLTMPLVGIISALGLHITAGRALLMRRARSLLMALAGVLLPLMVGVGVALLFAHLFRAPVPAGMLLGAATLLVIGINASYRGTTAPARLRHWPELAAAFLILALTALAAASLGTRAGQYGWTALRIYAGVATIMLTCYGILYGGAALVAVAGGSWRRKVEPANFAMALVLILACLALATPLADPVELSAFTQARRLSAGKVSPDRFDFGWLRGQGLRFGRDALLAMTGGPHTGFSVEAARDAAITLSTLPSTPAPTPTEIGANIAVRTPDARLPATLLAQDWSNAGDKVPPCLTRASVACDAWFMDLDGDGQDEILLVWGNDNQWWASAMKQMDGRWQAAASLASAPCKGSLSAMRAGDVATMAPLPGWRDLWVAGERLRLKPADSPQPDCAALNFGR